MAGRTIITRRAKKSIRNLYWKSTRKSIQRKRETKSLVDAMVELVDTTPLVPSNENRGILRLWREKGYVIYETTHCFVRHSSGIVCQPMDSKNRIKRKWYFACFRDLRNNTVYIVNAVFAKYADRLIDDTPSAKKFISAMKGVYTRKGRREAERRQLKIPFPENESKHYRLQQIINECVDRCLKKYFTQPLMEQLNYDDYLHGYCHQWVLENFHQGDKIFVITDFDYDIEDYALVHCGLFRNGKFYDVRGELNTIDDVLDEFDYGEEMDVEIMSLSKFRNYCKNNGLI